ncbi:MAG: hypothetical protein NWF04_05990 [Candidatus Bathyarchaeota archaeon]|nr:hypothetical protein [Candidatus Bathyarchaeota archaeon]
MDGQRKKSCKNCNSNNKESTGFSMHIEGVFAFNSKTQCRKAFWTDAFKSCLMEKAHFSSIVHGFIHTKTTKTKGACARKTAQTAKTKG